MLIHIPYMKELYTHMLYLIPVVSMGETCTGHRSCLQTKRLTSYSSTVGERLAIITSLAYITRSLPKQRNIVFIHIDATIKLIYKPDNKVFWCFTSLLMNLSSQLYYHMKISKKSDTTWTDTTERIWNLSIIGMMDRRITSTAAKLSFVTCQMNDKINCTRLTAQI